MWIIEISGFYYSIIFILLIKKRLSSSEFFTESRLHRILVIRLRSFRKGLLIFIDIVLGKFLLNLAYTFDQQIHKAP